MAEVGWWAPGQLDAWRGVGDPLADAAVEVLGRIDQQPHMESSLGWIERLTETAEVDRKDRKVLERFVRGVAELPPWLDWDAIERGRTFFVRYGLVHSTALLLGGLLESYSDTQIANVLMRTGRLHKDTYRRVFETGAMVYDIMIPDGLRLDRRGYRTVLKVRLMHAGVRRLMLRSKSWDQSAFGVPIGQEDMAFTLLMFDVATLRGAQRLGLRISEQQRADHHHLWRYVGYLMGVDEALLPATSGEAESLHDAITKRQRHDSHNGRALTQGVVEALSGRAPFSSLMRGCRRCATACLALSSAVISGCKIASLGMSCFRLGCRRCAVQRRAESSARVARSLERFAVMWGEWAIREGLGDEPARFPIPGVMR